MIAIHPAKLMYVKPRDPSGQRAVSLESMGASKQPLLWDLSGMNAFLTVALDEKWAERLYGAADLSRSFFVEATTCRPPEPTHRASDGTLETIGNPGHREEGQPSGSNSGCRAPSRNDRNRSGARPFRPQSDRRRSPPTWVRIRYRAT